jgi:hypothetical protein
MKGEVVMSTRKAKLVVMITLSGSALVVACGGGSGPVIDIGAPFDEQGGAVSGATSDRDPSPASGGQATPTPTNPQATGDGNGTSGQTSGGTSGQTSGGTRGQTSGGTSGQTSGGTSGQTSGGTSGTMAGCPPCDGTFTCDVTLTNMMTTKSTVPLVTKSGGCTFSSQGQDVVFACGGALTTSGQNVGTWANCTKASSSPPTTPDAG